MPRIDPLSLLKCLSVLLGPTGGIKSREEVHRLANLMTKFSKKLVSKCIYIQILKTTNTELLGQFMGAGGWNLIHMWLTDGILAKNWALIQELLELLLLCPVDIERLKSNNCPKLIKGLSKEGSHQGVRTSASRLVEQWLKIVKGEAAPNSVPAQIMTVSVHVGANMGQSSIVHPHQQQYMLATTVGSTESSSMQMQDVHYAQSISPSGPGAQAQSQIQTQQQQQLQEKLSVQPVQLHALNSKSQQQTQVQHQSSQMKKQSFVVVTSSSQPPVPVYKITIRDGKQVLAKVETDASNINNVLNANNSNVGINGDCADDVLAGQEDEEAEAIEDGIDEAVTDELDSVADTASIELSSQISSEVNQTAVNFNKDGSETEVSNDKSKDNNDVKDVVSSDSNKSSDKENRDSHKKDDKKSSNSSDKKSSNHHHSSSSLSKSSSRHGSSSNSHRSSSNSHRSSSHRSGVNSSSKSSASKDKSSRDKDKHSSSSSKHGSSNKNKTDREKEREREKEKLKKDQAEKDKATLEKVQGQALCSKMGKIPKKKAEDERNNDSPSRKSSTESRDSPKDNKDKSDPKRGSTLPEKKNISISIECRKNSQDSSARPKTVKTFNSKFRSTGLEEEVKPPPPRSAKKPNSIIEKKISPKLATLKRPSPPRESIPPPDKRAKLSLDSPTTPPSDEKKGGIKLIPPKPKPMVLQESDMFMDALTASTKSKEPRKRKRRTSISKDGPSESKKQEMNAETRENTSSPPLSPQSADEKSPVVVKPNFKFYQDTLETDEDKEEKEKEKPEDVVKKEREEESDDQKDNKEVNDEDERSNTPTPDDDSEETKASDSPEDPNSEISNSLKKESTSPHAEIRYVDGLRSVLVLQKRKGSKKTLKWKTDLESIRYFELDETERVNVTKTFTDMKQMEKQNEREAFQMARKLSTEDLMEEKTRWKPLIPVDLSPALVDPGKESREKDIQYAREKGILQALYFNRSMIPDSAAEPDEERHHVMTDPKIIPLDDLTGNKESEKDFTSMAWPEPKGQLAPQAPAMTNFHYQAFPHNQQPMMVPMGPQGPMGPMAPIPQQMMGPMGQMPPDMGGPMPSGGGGWRTGDGKVVVPDVAMNAMPNMPGAFPPGPEGPMGPPGMMGPPMYNQQDGFSMMGPEDMGYANMSNTFQGPPGPAMFGPGPNFQGGPRGGGPMHGGNRGRGGPGPGWYRGGPGRGGGWRGGGWRGNGKQPPVCRQFSKNGYCRVGDKCQYLHPGINCPPF